MTSSELLIRYFGGLYERAKDEQLLQQSITKREGKRVVFGGKEVIEFVNCSYLGLDTHPALIAAAAEMLDKFGVHFCCARSRFSIEPVIQLEEGLSALFGGRAVTFPSVSSTHLSALPLLASGSLLPASCRGMKVHMVFDELAHASMQCLRPILASNARISQVRHNHLDELANQVACGRREGEAVVYIADGVYSMGGGEKGGFAPVKELKKLAEENENLILYLDDAHGTSIFGDRGEGFVLSELDGQVPDYVFVNFSLAKGFGCNGGGIILPSAEQEAVVRTFGQTYVYSGPLDYSIVGAALASLRLHEDGTAGRLRAKLRDRIKLWHLGNHASDRDRFNLLNPIKTVELGDPDRTIDVAKSILKHGYFVSATMFPTVALRRAQLRICLSAAHDEKDIEGLRMVLHAVHTSKSNVNEHYSH